MKINDRVVTPDGMGTITGIDTPESRSWRFVVKLDNPVFPFDPCYFQKELQIL